MPTSYLLPCSCGRKLVVVPRQAGEAVECSCGRSLDVPTMLQMAALERADPQLGPAGSPRSWGVRQSLSLLGAVIFLGALGAAVFLLYDRPPALVSEAAKIDPQTIRRQTEALTPLQSRWVWRSLQVRGPDGRTPRGEARYDDARRLYREARLKWFLSMGVVLTLAGVGLGLVVVPRLMK